MSDRTKLWNDLATQIAVDSIRATTKAGSGHPTSSMSCAHLLSVLFADHLRYDVKDPAYRGNDRFVMSKGHAAPALYAVLKAIGATRRKILGIVMEQAVAETLLGFGVGLATSLGLNYAIENTAGLRASFPAGAILVSLAIMLVLAMLGSLISVRKAVSVDPTVVFRA